MELKEIQNVPMSFAVTAPFAASWSDDDRISVITEKELYILELVPDPNNVQQVFEFCRTLVEPSKFLPTKDAGIDYDSLIWSLNQRDFYRVVLDTCLAPNLTTTKSVPPYITQVAWSPAGMVQYNRCLLATMTNYGSLVLYTSRGARWHIKLDISSLWSKHCSTEWNDGDEEESFDVLQYRAWKLRTTAFTWSSLKKSEDKYCSFLAMGLQNGDVVIWRLITDGKTDLQAQMMLQINTGMGRVIVLHWRSVGHKEWLCVGDVKGVVKMFVMCMSGHELQQVSCTEVWPHSDKIQVSNIFTITSKTGIVLIIIKGSYVIAVKLDKEGRVLSTCPHLIGNLFITGLVPLDEKNLLLVTHSGSLNKLTLLENEDDDLLVKHEPVNFTKSSQSAYYGVTASHNKAIVCLVTSFCKMFDHLIQREPAQLIFFRPNGQVDSYTTLLENPSQHLTKYWDCLEVIRVQGPPFHRQKMIGEPDLDKLSLYRLKLYMWLSRFAMMQEDPDDSTSMFTTLRDEMKRAEKLIHTRYICEQARKLMQLKLNSMTSEDKQSLALMLTWMKKVSSEADFEGAIQILAKEILTLSEEYQELPDFETCLICGEKCSMLEDPTEARCVAGHALPRCFDSLLQCAETPFWKCNICHCIAINRSEMAEAPLCPYCDKHLFLDDRFILSPLEEEQMEEEENEKVQGESEVMEQDGPTEPANISVEEVR